MDARRANAAAHRNSQAVSAAQKDADVRQALERSRTREGTEVNEILSTGMHHAFFLRLRGQPGWQATLSFPRDKLASLLAVVEKKAPKLMIQDYGGAMYHIATQPWIRAMETWAPQGKGKDTQFRSLCTHLFAKFPTPVFLWSGFFESNSLVFAPIIASIAAGGSLYDHVKTGALKVPLTRKMCHEFLRNTADVGFMEAIRGVQVRAANGDRKLLRAWMSSTPGRSLQGEDEAFWATVLHWLSQQSMLDMSRVGPLCDYIAFRRRQDATFSMKGRGALATLRSMEEWHGNLQRVKASGHTVFAPSGYKTGFFDLTRPKATRDIWHVTEILTAKELADEGRLMRHCVYSYQWAIEKGSTSIWVVTNEDDTGHWRKLTVEVRNDLKRIVQVRGSLNRMPEARELNLLTNWAGQNGLTVSV